MYALKNLLTKNPIQLSGAVMAVVNALIVVGAIHLSGDAVAVLNTSLVAVFGLFVSSTTVNSQKLTELSQQPTGQ